MTKIEEIKKNLKWLNKINGELDDEDADVSSIWDAISNKDNELSKLNSECDGAIYGDNGDIEYGADLQDTMISQASEADDDWLEHQWIVGASKINDMDLLYVLYDDPTDVEPVDNDTLSGVVEDLIFDLKESLKSAQEPSSK